MNENIIKSLVMNYEDDVRYPFARVVELIGIDNTLKLTKEFAGSSVYFPKPRTIFKNPINRQICKEFNGSNYFELAVKYGVCEKTIRNVTDRKKR